MILQLLKETNYLITTSYEPRLGGGGEGGGCDHVRLKPAGTATEAS